MYLLFLLVRDRLPVLLFPFKYASVRKCKPQGLFRGFQRSKVCIGRLGTLFANLLEPPSAVNKQKILIFRRQNPILVAHFGIYPKSEGVPLYLNRVSKGWPTLGLESQVSDFHRCTYLFELTYIQITIRRCLWYLFIL